MPRFFVSAENITEHEIRITSRDTEHISKVLRLREGDKILVCDGRGFDYDAELAEVLPGEIVCKILAKRPSMAEANISVTLFQGIPKASKMEYIIQKTTELGITDIVPVAMERCVSRLDKNEAKKLERWRKIAAEAAKQSQRGIVPRVHEAVTFDEAVNKMLQSDLCFAPYECEETTVLKSVLTKHSDVKTVSFIIGPEGGFDLAEAEKLREVRIPTVTLGHRILRTETAGEAVLAMIMYEIGDVNK